jgi:biotin synthase
MLTAEQAVQLKEAGLTAYNHNLGDDDDDDDDDDDGHRTQIITSSLLPFRLPITTDTSREYYPSITTTRSYDDRLKTVENVRNAGISVCCGGILGLGNTHVQLTYCDCSR